VLLVKPDLVPASTSTELARLGARIVYFIGGPYAVSTATMDELIQSFVPSPTTTSTTSTSTSTTSTIETTPTTEFVTSTTLGPGESPVGTSTTTTTIVLPPPPPPSPLAAVAVQTAYAQLGKPYAWAGAGPASFDCSGLTAYVWKAAGVVLPHNAADQAELVAPVEPVASAWAPGDLLFYDTPIDHVAIYVGNGEMIEAEHSGVPVHLVAVRTQDLVGAGRPEPGESGN
jgi:cell wall-associated NlpC family hydrolase